jgi:hypothetical protein
MHIAIKIILIANCYILQHLVDLPWTGHFLELSSMKFVTAMGPK